MARPVTKGEQAAREAVAEFVQNDYHREYELKAWHAVFNVAGSDGWWHKATGCVWFATVPMGGGVGELVPVAMAERVGRDELRIRMGFAERPPEAPKDAANLDRERLRVAACRLRYHEGITPALQRKLADVARTLADLTTEVGQLDLPPLDLDSVK